jgi:carbonic anhydrase
VSVEQLINGYRAFRQQSWPVQRTLYQGLAKGQQPNVMIVSCCDSRVDPATIFSARPGELFIVRNVANVVPPFEQDGNYHGTSAALEFAVRKLRVSTILVLGHGLCGGVAAALAPPEEDSDFLSAWIELLRPAAQNCSGEGEALHAACERENVRLSLSRLMTFPFVADCVANGALRLEGAHFAIADGRLEWLQPDGRFAQVS